MRTGLSLLFTTACLACGSPPHYRTIIRNATIYAAVEVYDPHVGTLAIAGDSIVLSVSAEATADTVIDATGLILAPGFIDAHSHHDRGIEDDRTVLAALSQGVTTIVVGQDGFSHSPLAEYFKRLEAKPPAINVASFSGHNTLRDSVMGQEFRRQATSDEIGRMKVLLKADMEAGALGLSTGLEYDPGIYSAEEEVIELARLAAYFEGKYISHIRSEDRHFWKAVNEVLVIGREAEMAVQITHAKLAMKSLWGQADSLILVLDSARAKGIEVSADVYPYTYWQSSIRVFFPERNFTDRKEAEFILAHISPPEGIRISNFGGDESLKGKTIAQVSAERKQPPAVTLMNLATEAERRYITEPDFSESVVAVSMYEPDIARIMKWEHTGICSDGSSYGLHPRGYGAFTRMLKKYAMEDSVLSLKDAIYKMTSRNSRLFQRWEDPGGRGRILPGYKADLVLFDPKTVGDRSSLGDPHAVSSGICAVWVNGQLTYRNGKPTGRLAGSVIRRPPASSDK
jgi:N-acyl-D-amino-acid deacylase